MTRSDLLSVIDEVLTPFLTWLVPPLLAVSYLYFFSVLDWLTEIGHLSERWITFDPAIGIWGVIVLSLCVSGLVFARIKGNKLLLWIYSVLLSIAFGLVIVISSVSGSPKLEN